ncbi:hypothetical protein CLCR_02900 [Cladophialophora carrionii]|uniref:Mid2 domain-containing protein n=1 Tax=Cladophialophora carrionii TaxID=86049 RepID=A0A1C1D293_9EURO|nr:hypothetical protein CLCR_02900 [Cladophialophora carrionii]
MGSTFPIAPRRTTQAAIPVFIANFSPMGYVKVTVKDPTHSRSSKATIAGAPTTFPHSRRAQTTATKSPLGYLGFWFKYTLSNIFNTISIVIFIVVTPGPSQSSAEASIVTWLTDTSSTSTSFLPTSTPPSSTNNPPPTPAPTEVYTSVTTVTGEVRTVVVTPSAAASSDATLGQSSTDGGGGVSTGKVVGIVLGVALGIGILIGIAVYLWFRRRHNKLQEQRGPETAFVPRAGDGSPPNIVPSRQVSQMSTAGLLGSKAPRINTSMGILGSDLRSADPTISSNSASDRRSLGTDQRLNPYALYMSEQGRVSNVSLQDNQDYSRQLRGLRPMAYGFSEAVRKACHILGRRSKASPHGSSLTGPLSNPGKDDDFALKE